MTPQVTLVASLEHVDNEYSSADAIVYANSLEGDGVLVVESLSISGLGSVTLTTFGAVLPITAPGVYPFWTSVGAQLTCSVPGGENGAVSINASIFKRNP